MTTLEDELTQARPIKDTYLTVGAFDGVHVGHRHLVELLKAEASGAGCIPGVVTFRNHPRTVLGPGSAPPILTPIEERIRLLGELGIALVAPITFSREVSMLSAQEFVAVLAERLRMKGLVVGPDFALGHNRQGTPEALREMGRAWGFAVAVAEPFLLDGQRVSSTEIRQALAQGNLEAAARCLGRCYAIAGKVVHGEGRGGRELGYPTANLQVDPEVALPGDGIYATWAYQGQRRYAAAASIGVRPTFGKGNARTVEAFLLDFQGDLYGAPMRLEFVRRLREERAFPSVEALQAQMALDVEEARRALRE
ncbi:MAG: bifunctional riboflavin kinase/FAD synthetase [Chloroflexi bacterium]|nr:bifunctional riboflavin kinase/FAD synthetase [Chloroflexota bacterium]